jgi:hypothetical protein
MKKIILYIIMLTIVACSTNEKRFESIELIAYQNVKYESEDPKFELESRFICVYYAYLDNHYNGQLIFHQAFINPISTYYYQINGKDQTLRQIIDNMIQSSYSFDNELDLRPNEPRIYDGPEIKIRINFKNKYKLIHLEHLGEGSSYEEFFDYLDSSYRNKSLNKTEGIDYVQSRRIDFMKFASKYDSIEHPLPPNSKRVIMQ